MRTRSFSEPEVLVSGRRLGFSLIASICAAAGIGIVSYYGLNRTMANALGSAAPQIVTFAVYLTLVAVLCQAFRPPSRPPIALHFTSVKDLVYALAATVALIAVCALVYAFLGLLGGGFLHLLKQFTAVATDAKRLQGQGSSAWIVAILRGCLLVPIFEEVLFRGLLLSWLNQHVRFTFALLIQAVLFAAMHVYPSALPYAFVSGIATGYVRRRTDSTLNTILMHVINNLFLLRLGLYFFRAVQIS
jgi:membrane protease YdiL (CAAX protease family)